MDAFAFTITNGVVPDNIYTYKAKAAKCKKKNYVPSYYLNNACYHSLEGDEEMLKIMIARYGPLATGIHTTGTGLDLYSSGVFYDPSCSSDVDKGDHAVVGRVSVVNSESH